MGKLKKTIQSFFVLLITSCFLIGCQVSMPKGALKLSPDSLKNRQLQTRSYDTLEEKTLLSASAGVLQDMGYTLDESETKLGLIVASKVRETDNRVERNTMIGLRALAVGLGAISGQYDPQATRLDGIDKQQKIRVSLVTNLDQQKNNTKVRVTFQRQVWDMEGNLTKQETINQPDLYIGFFDKLSKSIFLEAHKI